MCSSNQQMFVVWSMIYLLATTPTMKINLQYCHCWTSELFSRRQSKRTPCVHDVWSLFNDLFVGYHTKNENKPPKYCHCWISGLFSTRQNKRTPCIHEDMRRWARSLRQLLSYLRPQIPRRASRTNDPRTSPDGRRAEEPIRRVKHSQTTRPEIIIITQP